MIPAITIVVMFKPVTVPLNYGGVTDCIIDIDGAKNPSHKNTSRI
jgi:hypothetical protein